MDEFEFSRGVTVGQYIPGTSFIHRLDARAKIVGFIILLVWYCQPGTPGANRFG